MATNNHIPTEEEILKYSAFLRDALQIWKPSEETKEILIKLGEFTEEGYIEFIKKFKDYYLDGAGKDKILYAEWDEQIKFWLKQRIEWKHEEKLKKAKINASAILQIHLKDIDFEVLIAKLKMLFPDNIQIHIHKQ